jgi:hypothetical protein
MHATIAATLIAVISVTAFAATQMGNIVSPPVTGITTLVKPALARPDFAGSSALTPTDKRSIETLVRAELRALIALDAERAFSKLTPSTQSFFGEPVRFLQAIADKVPPILQTRSFAFLGLERSASRIVQQVLITDSLGQEWIAEFDVEHQKSGDWRVEDCIVEVAPGQQA